MKFPKQNELIRVFNEHYPGGKLRYFKEKSPDPKSPVCVYADGHTKETNGCLLEYWDRWEYPKPWPNYKICKGSGKYSYHGHIQKCSCLTDPEKRNIKETKNNISRDISNIPLEAPKHDSEEGKPDLSLIPYDLINEMLLPAYEEGLQEYYRNSWRLGFPVLKMCAALLRHLFAFMFKHENYDPVTKEKYNIKKHHLGAVMFCCISIYNSLKINPNKFDDRANFLKKGEQIYKKNNSLHRNSRYRENNFSFTGNN